MLSKDIWPVAQFSRLSFDTTCLYVFAENKLISNVKKVFFFLEHPVYILYIIFIIPIKINVATDEDKSRNEICH